MSRSSVQAPIKRKKRQSLIAVRRTSFLEGLLNQPGMADSEGMNAPQLIASYCVGGAALALWLLNRFPRLGPRTIMGATGAVIAAFMVAGVVPSLLEVIVAARSRVGAVVALIGLVLPTLAAIFWSAACLLRAFCGLLSGWR